MAKVKKATMLFKLLSSANTGYFYVGKKSTKYILFEISISKNLFRFATRKLQLRKYDPLVNQYVVFNEVKLSSGRKK